MGEPLAATNFPSHKALLPSHPLKTRMSASPSHPLQMLDLYALKCIKMRLFFNTIRLSIMKISPFSIPDRVRVIED